MLTQRPSPALRRLRRAVTPYVMLAASVPGADRYRKHFTAQAHLWILLVHAMLTTGSLRCTHALLSEMPALWQQWGMDRWVSLSQLARSSTSRPAAPFEELYRLLLDALDLRSSPCGFAADIGPVRVLDSSFFPVSASRSPWAVHQGHEAGVRVQAQLALTTEADLVTAVRMGSVAVQDQRVLQEWALADLTGTTLVMDLGYYTHRGLARLRHAAVHFIIPLKPQAAVRRTATAPVPDDRWVSPTERILADETVTVGSPNNRRGTVLPGLRLITTETPAGTATYLTDRHDLVAVDVVRLYRRRWQIELAFRWIKHQLGGLHPLGTSPQALWLTILLAAIVHLLMQLLRAAKPPGISNLAWLFASAIAFLRVDQPVPAG